MPDQPPESSTLTPPGEHLRDVGATLGEHLAGALLVEIERNAQGTHRLKLLAQLRNPRIPRCRSTLYALQSTHGRSSLAVLRPVSLIIGIAGVTSRGKVQFAASEAAESLTATIALIHGVHAGSSRFRLKSAVRRRGRDGCNGCRAAVTWGRACRHCVAACGQRDPRGRRRQFRTARTIPIVRYVARGADRRHRCVAEAIAQCGPTGWRMRSRC
jgi:hypothetical protein